MLFDLRSIGPARNLRSAEAFRLREGAHEIARRLAERVGDRIRFADPVRAITQDADGVTIESDTCALRCRRVAVCVPPPLASQIAYTPALPDQRARLLASLPMGASVQFHAVYERPLWRPRGVGGARNTCHGTLALGHLNTREHATR